MTRILAWSPDLAVVRPQIIMSKLIRPVLLIGLCAAFTTCGQKGPLRTPEAGNLAAWVAAPNSQVL